MAPVGGQAVLEGVMMRARRFWAVAVRRPDGRISEIVARRRQRGARGAGWLRLPIIRGIVALGESLAIGFRALAAVRPASSATDEDPRRSPRSVGAGSIIGRFVFAIGFSLVLFKVVAGAAHRLVRPATASCSC